MAYYDRDYMYEEKRAEYRLPELSFVNKWLMGILAGVYLCLGVCSENIASAGRSLFEPGQSNASKVLQEFALTPHALFPFDSQWIGPWQLFTAPLMHASLFSLVFHGIFSMWLVGSVLEDMFGKKKYIVFLVSTAFIANLLAALIDPWVHDKPVSMGFAPLLMGMSVYLARSYRGTRVLFNLSPMTLGIIIFFVIALFSLQSYINQGLIVYSLPALIGGSLWGWVFYSLDMSSSPRDSRARKFPKKEQSESFLRLPGWEPSRKRSATTKIFPAISVKDPELEEANLKAEAFEKIKEEERKEREEIDALLDRISQGGLKSLSQKERNFLEKVSRRKRESSRTEKL